MTHLLMAMVVEVEGVVVVKRYGMIGERLKRLA
jgi:hypothetical protein